MEISIISIGNSKGIRLSKTILEKYKIGDSVELLLEEDCIVLKPKNQPRKNWEESFMEMHKNGEDELLLPDVFSDENFEEWN